MVPDPTNQGEAASRPILSNSTPSEGTENPYRLGSGINHSVTTTIHNFMFGMRLAIAIV
jgi:hypothetical protein